MTQSEPQAHADPSPSLHSAQERHVRKQRVLTKRTPSVVRSIANAIVIKDEDLFLLTERDGSVPFSQGHGFGLYYHDCRFLNGYELQLADTGPDALAATDASGYMATFQLTNPDLRLVDGRLIEKEHIGIKWERTIDSARLALFDLITFQNFEPERIELPVALAFRSAFEDVFAIRGLLPEHIGVLHPPSWEDGRLGFRYHGADGVYRSLTVAFSPRPHATHGTTAHFNVVLEPESQAQILVSLYVAETPDLSVLQQQEHAQPDLKHVQAFLHRSARAWLDYQTVFTSDNPLLNAILERSLRDLRVLRSTIDGQEFFSAGVPWFVTLFGRDSLISSLQTLAYAPDVAAHTLRLLARFQGERVDMWRDEQPGKIPHELRVGELARAGEVPQGRYYGTVDATLLFLILIAHHAAWTGDLALFNDLRSNVERALAWMAHYGDPRGWGYIAYESASDKGLVNQGWKDSGDAIVDADGSLAAPPIALVEVQGYAYLAKQAIADLYERAGEPDRAAALRREADDLRVRFNQEFWIADQGFYALALQAGKRPVAVRSSNPGQALWTGIADADKAQQTAAVLLADDLFSGWGVRTLSSRERRYNPIGYHLGTVWPHDNAIIAAGFRRYGFDTAFQRIFAGITAAATHFDGYRLPELFSGFERAEYGIPVRYPVACHPQAWAAGSVPFLVTLALGLVPEAFDRRLRIVRPILPDYTDRIDVRRLKVGTALVDLRFERTADGVAVQTLNVDGQLEVVVETEGAYRVAG